MLRPLMTAAFLFVAVLAWPVCADQETANQTAARGIITAQMEAFRADDAGKAFGFASPELQAKFGTASIFMEMVRSGYAPVYRPKIVEFRDWIESPRGPEQRVFVIGPDGRAYIAHYMMEQQPDESWRISGCYLELLGEESV